MALIISCDVINNDLVVKFYIFILYLNLCNIYSVEIIFYIVKIFILRGFIINLNCIYIVLYFWCFL